MDGPGVYWAAAAIPVWALVWHKQFWRDVTVGRFLPWVASTGFAYALPVVISRRAFRGVLPFGSELRVSLEEVLENLAHAMLAVTAFSDKFGASPPAPSEAAESEGSEAG